LCRRTAGGLVILCKRREKRGRKKKSLGGLAADGVGGKGEFVEGRKQKQGGIAVFGGGKRSIVFSLEGGGREGHTVTHKVKRGGRGDQWFPITVGMEGVTSACHWWEGKKEDVGFYA